MPWWKQRQKVHAREFHQNQLEEKINSYDFSQEISGVGHMDSTLGAEEWKKLIK